MKKNILFICTHNSARSQMAEGFLNTLYGDCYVDRMLFGRSYPKVRKAMDKPFKKLGKKHRVLHHDPLTASSIAKKCYPGDPVALRAALNHIVVDNVCTANPQLRDSLEAMLRIDRMRRRNVRTFTCT